MKTIDILMVEVGLVMTDLINEGFDNNTSEYFTHYRKRLLPSKNEISITFFKEHVTIYDLIYSMTYKTWDFDYTDNKWVSKFWKRLDKITDKEPSK